MPSKLDLGVVVAMLECLLLFSLNQSLHPNEPKALLANVTREYRLFLQSKLNFCVALQFYTLDPALCCPTTLHHDQFQQLAQLPCPLSSLPLSQSSACFPAAASLAACPARGSFPGPALLESAGRGSLAAARRAELSTRKGRLMAWKQARKWGRLGPRGSCSVATQLTSSFRHGRGDAQGTTASGA